MLKLKCFLLVVTILTYPVLSSFAQTVPPVGDQTLRNVESRPGEWLSHGRNYAETRYSPLKEVNETTVGKLGLAWSYDTHTSRGLEATPLIVGTTMYTTGAYSIVYALDARTGKELWRYDPEVPRITAARACCDAVNRGVAYFHGKVYLGTLDGRLVSLDAKTGKRIWEVVTVDQTQSYTITGAPRIVKGKVLIGNGGAEFGVRGYITAYDAETGRQSWRFYTVPGDPSKPFENRQMAEAAQTWNGEWWKMGGGGTVWDSMAYDPQLDLLYIGTGNGSPWNQQIRSPKGGDNLFLSSIIALRPDSGRYVWHYQTTPGDSWDYTATQHIILADLTIKGARRKVLLQAPKNGFFYVLDRTNGKLISAEPYADITWATKVDMATGRPVESPTARYKTNYSLQKPGPLGAHNWMPMSFNPQTGLVYIPAQDIPGFYSTDPGFKFRNGLWNLGVDFGPVLRDPPNPNELPGGSLLAWDPVRQKEAWRVPYRMMWNGGTLTTAGNLVFQGTSDGRFIAYSADKGAKLWEINIGQGIIGSPVTYQVEGVQYVSIMAGWGGAFALIGGYANVADINVVNVGRVLTFRLGGNATLNPVPKVTLAGITPIAGSQDGALIAKGNQLFAAYCAVCHGAGAVGGGGLLPMLPLSKPAVFDMYDSIVLDGSYSSRGMPGFGKYLSKDDDAALRAYILKRRADILSGK